MNIIIAGAGKVGFNLAKSLCIGHNVTIIDKNLEALERIQESLDILPLDGDVENVQTYTSFTDKNIDLFIAVTNNDNVNLIAILVADTVLNIQRKFVRLHNHYFASEKIQKRLDIEKFILPTKLASQTIASLLNYPKANNIKFFHYTKQKLISVMVSGNFEKQFLQNGTTKIVGIERAKKFFIPQEEEVEIFPNDLVYFFGNEEDINPLCSLLEQDTNDTIQNCVVFGGESLGIAIAEALIANGKNVKLVEKDLHACELADEQLKGKASVINSKYSSHDIFEEEAIENADIFISATNNDEYNIIKCLEAKESGVNKVVAINNEMEYYSLMHSLGIVVVRGPKMSAYNTIMEAISSTGIVVQKSYCGARANVFMRKIFTSSHLINKKIKPPKIQHSLLFYERDGAVHLFNETLLLQEDDLIICFCMQQVAPKIKQWIYGL
jgi:trk system potassium uptake protein TrkA